MSLLDWLWRPSIPADTPEYAVPLTRDDVALLLEALHTAQRLIGLLLRGDFGRWITRQANNIAQTAGIAAALNHHTTPQPVTDFNQYEEVLRVLQFYRAPDELAERFQILLTRMNVHAGMARIHGWTVRHTAAGMEWDNEPTADAVATAAVPQ